MPAAPFQKNTDERSGVTGAPANSALRGKARARETRRAARWLMTHGILYFLPDVCVLCAAEETPQGSAFSQVGDEI